MSWYDWVLMSDQNIDTKSKILEIARVLFANHGYEGTSIRDIAKAAEVNVASVNYHFTNKENLLGAILNAGYIECGDEIKRIFEGNGGNLEQTMVDLFKYYMIKSHDLISHFKMLMSSQHSHHLVSQGSQDGYYGPPGGMLIAEAIKRHVPTVSDPDLHWALKTLFSHVSHLAIIQSCCLRDNNDVPYSTPEDNEKSIRRVTRIVLSDLKNSP